jgi:hypothetical protein
LGHDGLSNLLVGDNDNWNNAKAGTRTWDQPDSLGTKSNPKFLAKYCH